MSAKKFLPKLNDARPVADSRGAFESLVKDLAQDLKNQPHVVEHPVGQLKRAQTQGHLPSGGDWAQYVDTILGLTPRPSSLQGRPIAPGTALNTGPTFSLTFKNLDQVEQHLRSFSGKPLTTADGLTANVSNQTAAKMASGSAVKKIRRHSRAGLHIALSENT